MHKKLLYRQRLSIREVIFPDDCLVEIENGNQFCVYQVRQEPWTGEGRPPVGVLIEMKHKRATSEWARPDFHEEQLAWVGREHFVTVDEKFGDLSDYLFRPIRTPEQIADEAREAAIKDLMQLDDIYHDQAAAIYDAGYRKVSP